MCPLPCGTGVTPKNGMPLAPTAWQVVQPVVIPEWFIVPGLYDPGRPRWHSVHAAFVGMWFAGLPPPTPLANDVVDVWQLPQSPVGGCAGSCAAVGRVTIVTPKKLLPVSWQVAHGVPATGA